MKKLLFLSTLALSLGSQAFGMCGVSALTKMAEKACKHGYTSVVEKLLARGVSLNEPDAYGLTLLHVAALHGRYEIVKLLLEEGNIHYLIRTSQGETPIDWARLPEIIKLIESKQLPIIPAPSTSRANVRAVDTPGAHNQHDFDF